MAEIKSERQGEIDGDNETGTGRMVKTQERERDKKSKEVKDDENKREESRYWLLGEEIEFKNQKRM